MPAFPQDKRADIDVVKAKEENISNKMDISVVFNSISQKSESDEVNQTSEKEELAHNFSLVLH